MLVPKETVLRSKEDFGEKAAGIIAADLEIQNWDEENIRGSCPFGHVDDTPSFIWNHKTSSFHCFSCGRNYGIIDHYIYFNKLTYLGAVQKLFEETGTKFSFGEKGVKTERDYKYPYYHNTSDRSTVEKYLATRKISKETLDFADVQQDEHGNIVFNYYDTNDVLTLVKYRPARKVAKGENKSWCQKDADTMPLLYNMNRVDFTNGPLVLTEGETDTLAVIESGYKNVVSVPFGANSYEYIQKNWEWLELFDKIIVWSDNDEAGMKMRKEVCSRLGTWRTFYVETPAAVKDEKGNDVKIKDINEVLYYCGKQAVLDLIATAKELPIVGIRDLSTVEDFDIDKAPGLYSGLEVVDKTIYKFLFGSVVLVTGLRGAGKSTLLNQCFICEPLEQGYDTFIFSGELGAPVLQSWVELTMAGPEQVKMKNDFVHIINSEARKEIKSWYTNRTWVYDQTSNKLEDILEKAVSVTRKYGVKVWLLDNLSTIDLGASDNNLLEKQKNMIVELNKYARLYGVLIVLVIHPRKLPTGQEMGSDDIGGSGAMANLAAYALSVKRFQPKDKLGEKDSKGNWKKGKEPFLEDTEINIMKNRYTGKIGEVKVFFNYKSYRFFSNAKELFKRYGWDKNKNRPMPKIEDEDPRFNTPDFMKVQQ